MEGAGERLGTFDGDGEGAGLSEGFRDRLGSWDIVGLPETTGVGWLVRDGAVVGDTLGSAVV